MLVCVPTYNEEKAVKEVIRLLREKKLDFVVCDGFSTDRTVAFAKEEGAECISRQKPGKGSAIVKCLEVAAERNYDYMGVIDCDLTYSIDDLIYLYQLAQTENMDLIVGARPFGKIAWHRRAINYLVTFYFNVLFGTELKDILSGLRIVKVDRYNTKIDPVSFDFEPRSIAYAVKQKFKFSQVPVSYTERIGESKASLIELLLILWGITHERCTP